MVNLSDEEWLKFFHAELCRRLFQSNFAGIHGYLLRLSTAVYLLIAFRNTHDTFFITLIGSKVKIRETQRRVRSL